MKGDNGNMGQFEQRFEPAVASCEMREGKGRVCIKEEYPLSRRTLSEDTAISSELLDKTLLSVIAS